tara:strand:- start:1502 stop:1831 length:330 start_codon:yes stop_codon:yes gene_type:complete
MTEQEISDWEREINHAQMMWRLSYKHEVNKRNEQMAWNEAQANESMASTVEQERLDARQLAAKTANEAKRDRTTIDGSWLFVRAIQFISAITLASVAYRLIVIYFLGDV